MITIAEIQSARYTATGDQIIRAVLFADTVADLPASPTAITGYILTQGSTCRVIADSTLYMMQSSGTWIQQLDDITADTYTRQQIDALIAQQAADLVAAQTTLQADIMGWFPCAAAVLGSPNAQGSPHSTSTCL